MLLKYFSLPQKDTGLLSKKKRTQDYIITTIGVESTETLRTALALVESHRLSPCPWRNHIR